MPYSVAAHSHRQGAHFVMTKISTVSASPMSPVSHRFWKQGLLLGLGASLVFSSLAAVPASAAPKAAHTAMPMAQGATTPQTRQALKPGAKRINISVKTTANVNLRQGASAKKKSLKLIPKGTTLRATAQAANGWYKVSYKGIAGHVSNAHAKKVTAGKPAATNVSAEGPSTPASTAPTVPD